jgi:transposase
LASSSPFKVELSAGQREELEHRARSYTAPYWQVVRAKVVLLAAGGMANNEIAERVGTSTQVVHRWRRRFCEHGLDGLKDRERPGRPRTFGAQVVTEVKVLACELPATTGVPLSRWSCTELARELVLRGIVAFISASTVWRTLAKDAIRPWYHRMWIFPRDPDFAAKAYRVLDLYARVFEGQPLGDKELVICADEKTSVQARCRCHPSLPPGRARLVRVEHEYERKGAVAYMAAYDVHRAKVFGRCEETTGIAPFGRLVEQVMTAEPYASAERVFWVVDNGSSHRGQASIDRLEGEWPTLRLVHLPVHASWLDQAEIYFSVVQRKVLSPNDFFDTDAIADLDDLLARIARHEATAPLVLEAAA